MTDDLRNMILSWKTKDKVLKTKQNFANLIKTMGLMSVYPVLFMFPALFRDNVLLARESYSDVRHYVWMAQQLRNMKFPWSYNYMYNAPEGASFWNPAAFVNGIYWIMTWILTRAISPLLTVNLLIFFGWVLSGFVSFLLARKIGSSYLGAICSGLFLQMLPWFREKVLTHPLYVFWFVPILILILIFNFIEQRNFKNLFILASALLTTFFVDLYWFWFSVNIFVIIFIIHSAKIVKSFLNWCWWQKIITSVSAIAFPVSVYLFFKIFQEKTQDVVTWERPLAIAPIDLVNSLQGRLEHFLIPPPEHLLFPGNFLLGEGREDAVNYLGVSVLLLAVFGITMKFKNSLYKNHLVSLAGVSVVFALLTLPTYSMFLGVRIGWFVDVLRYLNPGLRFYSRTGMITQAVICVLAGLGVTYIVDRVQLKKILVVAVVLVVSIDLNPFARRLIDSDFVTYSIIREKLTEFDSPVTLELTPDTNRLYFPRHYLDSAKAFTWEEYTDRFAKVRLHASRGDAELHGYLISREITHVLVSGNVGTGFNYRAKWGQFGRISLGFDSKYFKFLAYANGRFPATLFELRKDVPAILCAGCKEYSVDWRNVHEGFAGVLWNSRENNGYYQDSVDLSWVLAGERPTFQIVAQDGKMRSYEVNISMVAAFGPKAPPQVVTVTSKDGATSFDLVAGIQQDVKIVVNSGDVVELESQMPCVVPEQLEPGSGDFRELCFGVTDFKVREVFP